MRAGPGSCARTRARRRGLEVAPLSDDVRAELATFLPAEAALANPVDMIATAPAEHYRRARRACWRDIRPPMRSSRSSSRLAHPAERGRDRDPGGHRRDRRTGAGAGRVHDGRGRTPGPEDPTRAIPCLLRVSRRTLRGHSRALPNTACGARRPRETVPAFADAAVRGGGGRDRRCACATARVARAQERRCAAARVLRPIARPRSERRRHAGGGGAAAGSSAERWRSRRLRRRCSTRPRWWPSSSR